MLPYFFSVCSLHCYETWIKKVLKNCYVNNYLGTISIIKTFLYLNGLNILKKIYGPCREDFTPYFSFQFIIYPFFVVNFFIAIVYLKQNKTTKKKNTICLATLFFCCFSKMVCMCVCACASMALYTEKKKYTSFT